MNNLLITQLLSADDVLMEPQYGTLKSRSDAKLKPFIYSAPMDTVTGYALAKAMLAEEEIPVICRELPDAEYNACLKDFHSTPAFFAVGATPVELQRFVNRLAAVQEHLPNDLLVNVAIDIAHGDSQIAVKAAAFLRSFKFVGYIMSGSVCTFQGALRASAAGCTHIRIGVGPGSVCTTRLMTGCGVPQLSAVALIHHGFVDYGTRNLVTLIADGGIRYPGDAAKYLAAGADAIMMGSVFSKAEESPGWTVTWPETDPKEILVFPRPDPTPVLVKSYRGHASAAFQQSYNKTGKCPEGVHTKQFAWQGETVKSICETYRGGVSSAISYLGLESLDELKPENVKFMKITTSTLLESRPHHENV